MVTDPCSAVVPQLTLTITDIDKNTERTFTTNDSGVYDSRTLLPANRCLLIFRKESFITDYGHQLGYLQSEPEY